MLNLLLENLDIHPNSDSDKELIWFLISFYDDVFIISLMKNLKIEIITEAGSV